MNEAAQALLLASTPGLPLLLACALMVWPASRSVNGILHGLAPWAALPGLSSALLLPTGVSVAVPWVLQGSEFALDETARLFLAFSAAIWLAGGLTARAWVTTNQRRFLVYFLLVMSGSLGLIVSADSLAFYLFFALMSFASYGLVVHGGGQRARHAGRIYMVFVLAGDMMLFAALVLIAHESGDELGFDTIRGILPSAGNRDLAMALLVLGLGVKAGVLGVHVTLPLIYAVAPMPAAVVLAGAMINAGLLGWLRLLPVEGGTPGWGRLLTVAGVAAAFYGALAGAFARRARVVLAYSSISQMGIMTMGVGVALMATGAVRNVIAAVSVYALHHAFAKGSLFLGTGMAERVGGRQSRAVKASLLIPALALAGAPLTTGMLAKEWLKEALSAAPHAWQGPLKTLLPAMALATTLVLARFIWLVWRVEERDATVRRGPLQRGPLVAWLVLLALTLSGAWLVPRETSLHLWRLSILWEVSWPVLLGAGISVAVALPQVRSRLPAWRTPPGDVLAVMTATASASVRAWRRVAEQTLPTLLRRAITPVNHLGRWPGWGRVAAGVERRLVDWRTASLLYLLVLLALWLLATSG